MSHYTAGLPSNCPTVCIHSSPSTSGSRQRERERQEQSTPERWRGPRPRPALPAPFKHKACHRIGWQGRCRRTSQQSEEVANVAPSLIASLFTRNAMQTPDVGVSTPTGASTALHGMQLTGNGFTNRGLTSARRKSPFHQAPSKRRIPQHSQLEENADPQKIASLLRKQWKLYSVTPLYSFSYSRLKEYSRMLSAFIAAEEQKGLAVEVGVDLGVRVAFSTLLGLKGRLRDPGAVHIQVLSRPQFAAPNSEDKVVWTGWFCCTFGDDDMLDFLPEAFTCLPLFLVNGTEIFTAIVGSWFQKTFDCCFSDLAISSRDLSWMAAMWTGYDVRSHVAATELLFSVPIHAHGLDISYAIHAEDARALWDDIHKNRDEVTEDEVQLFLNCLYSHFFRHFKIHLSATRLVKVSTSVASVHCNGKVKFLCSDHLIRVLALLTELAINQIQY